MSAPKTPLLDELAARTEGAATAKARIREVDDQAHAARNEAARIKEELTEAFAADNKAQADKLTRAKVKADAKAAEPWDERRAGAQRAAERVRAERDTWIARNISGLLAELAPTAEAARAAIVDGAQALDQARREWHAIGQRVDGLLNAVPGAARGRVPSIDHIDSAIRDAMRATADMPSPMPQAVGPVSFAPGHEPDAERVSTSRLSAEDKERFAANVVRAARNIDPDQEAA